MDIIISVTKMSADVQSIFPESILECLEVDAADCPEESRELLFHKKHMTLTLESHFNCKISLNMIRNVLSSKFMGREIILEGGANGAVLYAIANVHLDVLDTPVREDILLASQPIGHILVKHNVPREVFFERLVRVKLVDSLLSRFGQPPEAVLYGRNAFITCNGVRAIDLLEVLLPPRDF